MFVTCRQKSEKINVLPKYFAQSGSNITFLLSHNACGITDEPAVIKVLHLLMRNEVSKLSTKLHVTAFDLKFFQYFNEILFLGCFFINRFLNLSNSAYFIV